MRVFALRNDKGEYISSEVGHTTLDWFEAIKFSFQDIGKHARYVDPSFKIVEFRLKEVYTYSNNYE